LAAQRRDFRLEFEHDFLKVSDDPCQKGKLSLHVFHDASPGASGFFEYIRRLSTILEPSEEEGSLPDARTPLFFCL